MKIKAAILGVSGYTGQQLLSILSNHNQVTIEAIFGSNTVGKRAGEVLPVTNYASDIEILDSSNYDFSSIDVVFSCLPHRNLHKTVENINSEKIIDLSADFRFSSAKKYEDYYNFNHRNPELLEKFVYGLSEINEELIRNSNFIANPGCYPTSILIPLIPILNRTNNDVSIMIDAKSGMSGAGKTLTDSNLFVEINENLKPYKIFTHRHQPEIMEQLEKNNQSFDLTFVPHLIPISRGILSTIYLKNVKEKYNILRKTLEDTYQNSCFVKILPAGIIPNIKNVLGTNNICINIFEDNLSDTIVIISVIDNLIKGAAGQAVQNMNLMYNLNVCESLKKISMIP